MLIEKLEECPVCNSKLNQAEYDSQSHEDHWSWGTEVKDDSRHFQNHVAAWMQKCFGPEVSSDISERNFRFLEEALELVQACRCSEQEAMQLVAYVYGRPPGVPEQEVGGVMVTLAALCAAHGGDMHKCGEVELLRIWDTDVMDRIRKKQATKPQRSPLPGSGQ